MIEHQVKAAGGSLWRTAVEARRHGTRLEVLPRKTMPPGCVIIWLLVVGVFGAVLMAIWEILMATVVRDDLSGQAMRWLAIAAALLAAGGPLLIWSFLQLREHQLGAILLVDQAARQITLPRFERSWPLSSVLRVGINKGWHIEQRQPGHTSFTSERWLTVVVREGESERMYRVGRNLSARGGMKRIASMIAETAGCPLDESLLRTTVDQKSANEQQREGHAVRGRNAGRVVAVIFMALGALSSASGLNGLVRGHVSSNWPVAQGTVLSSEVVDLRGIESSYRADVRYIYIVDGTEHIGDQIRPQDFLHGRRSDALRIVLRYPAGAAVNVHCNPRHPEVSLLEPGANHSGFGLAAFGAVFFAIGIFIFIVLSQLGPKGGSTSISVKP